MLIFLWGILIFAGFLFPKSKSVSFMMLIFMIVTIACRTQGADYIVYQNEYKWSEYQTFSEVHYVGYLVLEQFAHSLNFTFEQFVFVTGMISCILTYTGFKKLTYNINIVFALYFLYPFSHEAVQTRTFLANAILIAALPLILKEPNESDEKRKKRKYGIRMITFFVLSILACTFHFEASVYVVFFALMLFLPQKYGKIYIFSGTMIAFLLIESNLLPKIVLGFNTRIAYWLSGKTGVGIVIPVFITLAIWYTMQVVGKYCLRLVSNSEKDTLFYRKLLRLSDFVFLLIPLFCYDITFNRLWRLFLIVLYIMIAKVFPYKTDKNRQWLILFCMIVLMTGLVIYEKELTLLVGIMKNNLIFKGLSVL